MEGKVPEIKKLNRANYRFWKKKNLVEEVKRQRLLLINISKKLRNKRREERWERNDNIVPGVTIRELEKKVSVLLPIETYNFIQQYNINMTKVLIIAVEELKKQV